MKPCSGQGPTGCSVNNHDLFHHTGWQISAVSPVTSMVTHSTVIKFEVGLACFSLMNTVHL